MKQYFVKQCHLPSLVLFFAGWGMDEHPFQDYNPKERDLLVCYDYRSLDFDFSLLKEYRDIRVIGWSMGVWAASQVLSYSGLPITESIAVNGTMTPVDDSKGISNVIFQGTLNGLNDITLRKFFRRMCGSAPVLDDFLSRRPQRSVEELKEELSFIGRQAGLLASAGFRWNKAVVGKGDLIFIPDNQKTAWSELEVQTEEVDFAHYSDVLLRSIVCGKENFDKHSKK